MRRMHRRIVKRLKKHMKRHMSFIEAVRRYAGMPVY